MSGTTPDPRQGEISHPEPSRSPERPICARPGCGKPAKVKWCSRACSTAWWDEQHPRINRGPEGPRQDTIKAAILGILHDGEWHTKADLAFQARAHEHSVGSRISELRRKGFRIESDAPNGNSRRAHRFRLLLGT